jgi:hypothetical protein
MIAKFKQTVDAANAEELQILQERLQSKIRVGSPATDGCFWLTAVQLSNTLA